MILPSSAIRKELALSGEDFFLNLHLHEEIHRFGSVETEERGNGKNERPEVRRKESEYQMMEDSE